MAQIALGTLGFTGVVVALKHSTNNWNSYEKVGFQALVTTTLTALVASLLPQIIGIATDNSRHVWRLANLGIGIMHLANFTSIIYSAYKYQLKAEVSTLKDTFDVVIGPTFIIMHFVAALGYIPCLEFLLVLGVVQQLYIGLGNFLKFISWKNVN